VLRSEGLTLVDGFPGKAMRKVTSIHEAFR